MRRAALLAAALVVHGCAPAPVYPLYTSHQVAGTFGYREQQVSDSRYLVTYDAPVLATSSYRDERRDRDTKSRVALAYDLALWRAAELTLANGFPAFIVAERNNDVQVTTGYDPYPYPYFHFGHRHRHYPYHYAYPYYDPYYDPFYGYAYLAAGVTLAVEFRRAGAADTVDARATRERLRAQYAQATAAGSAGY